MVGLGPTYPDAQVPPSPSPSAGLKDQEAADTEGEETNLCPCMLTTSTSALCHHFFFIKSSFRHFFFIDIIAQL